MEYGYAMRFLAMYRAWAAELTLLNALVLGMLQNCIERQSSAQTCMKLCLYKVYPHMPWSTA
jgi:hypothetical protein